VNKHLFTVDNAQKNRPISQFPDSKISLPYFCRMAGLYIHIPFCRKACHYCNFHFSTSLQSVQAMVDAICEEAVLQKAYITEPLETIYFGGGTPSLLTKQQLGALLQTFREHFSILPGAEISLEANPDDITPGVLEDWLQLGINRLSIGVQSFFGEDLIWMNRAHQAEQAVDCIVLAQKAGFNNISIDLIYGSPGLTDQQWQENINRAIELGVPHLSCYAMTIEPKTALAKMIETRQSANTDPDTQARHFEMLTNSLDRAGFEQYEISNFAKPGFRSRHNSSYWQGKHYLGLGPSAHSFNGSSRQWNIANNALYIQTIRSGSPVYEKEMLTPIQQLNEYLMTALRTVEGISLEKVAGGWGEIEKQRITEGAQKHIKAGNLYRNDAGIGLTEKGKFLADGIAADLFLL
jgi:oxygen-independent coproporphyrinogen-3 oxidase